jgi:hypothetical protein
MYVRRMREKVRTLTSHINTRAEVASYGWLRKRKDRTESTERKGTNMKDIGTATVVSSE